MICMVDIQGCKNDDIDGDDDDDDVGDYGNYYDAGVYQKTQRGGQPPTQEELDSSLVNKAPGCPSLSILSFTNAFHGRTMGKHPGTYSFNLYKLSLSSLQIRSEMFS